MLRVTPDSPAVLGVLHARESIDIERTEVVGHCHQRLIAIDVHRVHIRAIGADGENPGNFPAKLASEGGPEGCVSQVGDVIIYLLALDNVVELLSVSLVNHPQVLRVMSPVHCCDCGRVNVLELCMQGVVSLRRNRVNVNCIVVSAHCEELAIWRELHNLAPLPRVK